MMGTERTRPHALLCLVLAFPVEYLLNPLFANSADATILMNDVRVSVTSIHSDIAIVTLLTMVPVAVFAALRVWRKRAVFVSDREVGQPAFARRDT